MVGDAVEIRILSVGHDQVRIGISAPREVPVHRREIYDSITRQNRLASSSATPPRELLERLKRS
ncbi:MAG: carbon storage regulator [Acidobacteriota bacterium]